ncbi:MAG: hypothetical protein NTY64_04845 [Deltaproteobacteria bacterium]|nr:hypothetical protein [Deltaproteobacteria bacterium]
MSQDYFLRQPGGTIMCRRGATVILTQLFRLMVLQTMTPGYGHFKPEVSPNVDEAQVELAVAC